MNFTSDLLGAAIAYARRGWPILPLYTVIENKCSCGDPNCKSAGKHPRISEWNTNATTNEDQIRAWFTQWPDSNVAVLLGQASGLVVIDVDGKAGMDWIESIDTSGALIASSGKEFHRHYIFRAPEIAVRTRIRMRYGVDFLADNRYLVVEPSRHYSGSIYEFYNLDSQAPGPLPAEILAIVQENASTPPKNEISGATIRAGNRNSTLASLAGKMRRDGFSRDAIYAALRETNMERCDPPLDEVEIEGITKSIAKYEPGTNPPSILKTISATSLLKQDFPPIRWVVKGLLPEGLGILAGRPKDGKSLLSLQIATSCIRGTPFLDEFPVEKGRCLFLGLEDSKRRLKERTLFTVDLGDQRGLDLLEFATEIPPSIDGGIDLIKHWLMSNRDARLIVIDTMAKIRRPSSRNSNMYLEDTAFLSPIQKLALDYQVCILLIHHTRKAFANDPLDAISGSTGITGVADQCWLLSRKNRKSPDGKLNIIGRDVENQILQLHLAKSLRWYFKGIDNEPQNTPEREEILLTLAEASGPMKTSEIAQKLGKSPSLMSHLLSKLKKDGGVVSLSYGLYALPKMPEGENE